MILGSYTYCLVQSLNTSVHGLERLNIMRMPKYATNLWAWHSSSPVQCSTPVVHSTVPFHHSTPPNSHSRYIQRVISPCILICPIPIPCTHTYTVQMDIFMIKRLYWSIFFTKREKVSAQPCEQKCNSRGLSSPAEYHPPISAS